MFAAPVAAFSPSVVSSRPLSIDGCKQTGELDDHPNEVMLTMLVLTMLMLMQRTLMMTVLMMKMLMMTLLTMTILMVTMNQY